MKKLENRIFYIDTLKGLSILIVFSTHFIAEYCGYLFKYWQYPPLQGLTGKFGVSLFMVISGYFAFHSAQKRQRLLKLIFYRYIYFLLASIIISTAYYFFDLFVISTNNNFEYTFINMVSNIFLLTDNIVGHLWCIPYLFLGSILSYINSKFNIHPVIILFEIIIGWLIYKNIWPIMCLFGNFAYIVSSNQNTMATKITKKISIICLIVFALLIQQPESQITYLFDALFITMLIICVSRNPKIYSIINHNTPIAFIGQQSMGIFLIHELSYLLVGRVILNSFLENHKHIGLLTIYIGSLFLSCLLGFIINYIINYSLKFIKKYL